MARVLLLETDKPLAVNLQKFLEDGGHEVDWQVDPQLAMDSADMRRPDIVILDLLLASRSGVEFLYEFRSYPDWQQLPVVVFSNLSVGEVGSSAIGFDELNIAAFHYKPTTSLAELSATIDGLLQPAG